MALSKEICHKSDHANSIVNKYDCINMNVITVTKVIILLEDSGSAENKEILLFSHDKLLLASILRPLHQVTKEMLV